MDSGLLNLAYWDAVQKLREGRFCKVTGNPICITCNGPRSEFSSSRCLRCHTAIARMRYVLKIADKHEKLQEETLRLYITGMSVLANGAIRHKSFCTVKRITKWPLHLIVRTINERVEKRKIRGRLKRARFYAARDRKNNGPNPLDRKNNGPNPLNNAWHGDPTWNADVKSPNPFEYAEAIETVTKIVMSEKGLSESDARELVLSAYLCIED